MSCSNKCQDILYKVKKYLKEKDMEGLKQYIEKEEKDISKCKEISKNETEEYIDKLVRELM